MKLDNSLVKTSEKNGEMILTVSKGLKLEEPVELLYEHDEKVNNIKIIYEENSNAIFIFKGELEEKCLCNLKLKVEANMIAKGSILVLNLLSKDSKNNVDIENSLKENASLDYCIIDLGGCIRAVNYNTKLFGDNAKNKIKNIYVGNNEDVININYNIETIGKNTECNLEVQGAIKDNAKKDITGTIDFKEGSKRAIGKEKEADKDEKT